MRNLKLLHERSASVLAGCKHLTVDSETETVYIADDKCIRGYSFEHLEQCFELDLKETSYFSNVTNKLQVVGVEFLCGEEQICIALQHGDILLCSTADANVDCVGTLDSDLQSMSWSPDQEIVLFLTQRGTAVAMNHDFDPIVELEISSEQFGEGTFVNVGWGSKETQFQGSSGKHAYKKEIPTAAVLHDDNQTKVVWRGDGQYFAISAVEKSERKFRVWNRSCELQYSSESIPGLESCFAWKPSGSLIASSQRKVHRHDIVFFELNGLQHGEFTLPFRNDQVHINKLEWNCDSTIFALWASDFHKKQTYIQLWTASNYHWSLKQSMELDDNLYWVSWDSEQPYNLHVISENGTYTLYHWAWCTNTSKLPCIEYLENGNLSVVSVIDGEKLKVTPFKSVVVPPPMCAFQMVFNENVRAVCFLEGMQTYTTMGVLLNGGTFVSFGETASGIAKDEVKIELMACGGNGFTSTITPFEINGIFKPMRESGSDCWQHLRHLVWHAADTLTAIAHFDNKDHVITLTLDKINLRLVCSKCLPVDNLVISTCSGAPLGDVLIHFKNGEVFLYDGEELLPFKSFGEVVCFKHPSPEMQLCSFSESTSNERVFGLLALSVQNRLFLNNIVLSAECTSFYVQDEYIIYTTSSHKLIFESKLVSLADLLVAKPSASLEKLEEKRSKISRSLERGSRLVVVTPHDTKVVLQLPRGNLETIHPRPLVISVVKSSLDKGSYKSAFVLMRKHRINLNLMHDHNPATFFERVSQFVSSLDCAEYINLFLSELREENVTITMYNQFYPACDSLPKSILSTAEKKIDKICEAVLKELYSRDQIKYFLSILTAYVRKSSPEIEKALLELKRMKDEDVLSEKLLADALRHLHVMVDGNVLFREALATYDLNLTLTVAQVSNNDPKEYVPFLNEMKDLEENFKRYKIDMHLKKYDKALTNISKCPEYFDLCLELAKVHNLHREALALFRRYTPEYLQITNSYAEYLLTQHKYEEAGIILTRCENHKRAIKCFITAGCWQLALNCATSLQYTKENRCDLGKSLAVSLVSKNDHTSAASVLVEVGDYESAIDVLCKGRFWSNALRLVRLYKLKDMIDTHFVPCLKETSEDMMTLLQSYLDRFDGYYTRLQIVREIKRLKEAQVLEGNCGDGGDLESDIASDFGSTLTGSSQSSVNSRTSQRTAKSRKKQERKRFSLREGSRFEEEGLLQALHELYAKLSCVQGEIPSMIRHMALYFLDEEAHAFQKLFSYCNKVFAQAIPKIWIPLDANSGSALGAQSTVNSILATRASSLNAPISLDHLEIRIPPKFKPLADDGMHLYSDELGRS